MSSIRIVICAAWLWFSFKRLIQYCSWMKLLFFSVFVLLRNKRVISGSHILRDRIQLIGALQTYQVITNHQQCNVFCKSDESLPSVIWKKKIHLFSCINTYRMCINTPPTPGQTSLVCCIGWKYVTNGCTNQISGHKSISGQEKENAMTALDQSECSSLS